MSKNILYIMLMKELAPLHCLQWFCPIGSILERLMNLCYDSELEGISRAELAFVRNCAVKARNLPDAMIEFLSAIGRDQDIMERLEWPNKDIESAIDSLIWNILIDNQITPKKITIIEKIWLEIMGYNCPLSLKER